MGKMILPAGTERAIHVYTKVLVERMKENKNQMLWLVRSSLYNYKKAIVCRRVEWNGPCRGEDQFDKPLPGTGGRGVAILHTAAELTLYFDGDKAQIIDMDDDAKLEVQPVFKTATVPTSVNNGPRVINRRTRQAVS